MSGSINTTLLPASGVGCQAVVAHLPFGFVAGAAKVSLPYTAVALGAYFGLALTMLLVGFVIRLFSNARQNARQEA